MCLSLSFYLFPSLSLSLFVSICLSLFLFVFLSLSLSLSHSLIHHSPVKVPTPPPPDQPNHLEHPVCFLSCVNSVRENETNRGVWRILLKGVGKIAEQKDNRPPSTAPPCSCQNASSQNLAEI